MDLNSYDHYIVATSGGKDSQACILHLLECGIPKDKIELWHHLVDGREGSTMMDWPITEDYVQKFGDSLGLKVYFSWKQGGFEREMLRENSRTAPTTFEMPEDDNIIECSVGGIRGKNSTRRKFPQVTASLSQRWCSAYLKIDVCTAAINNQIRFRDKRTLVVTGERAEESAARANYKEFEPDRSDNRDGKRIKRHVDHWRPVHSWSEKEVWDIIERFKINPHPAYRLGWGRLSCIKCIFGSDNQWATINQIDPKGFNKIGQYEKEFGLTIHRTRSVYDRIIKGSPYPNLDPEIVKLGLNKFFTEEIILRDWVIPCGAFGENAGPS
jgi:3'-phosphoadenosine 5'-phosphosulfate sulfotransferase (PAPS reductase)/FAD synthetase